MKLAIISDIHDNPAYLKTCLEWCSRHGIDEILCCGDITRLETLKLMDKLAPVPLSFIRGNADVFEDKEIKNLQHTEYLGRTAAIEKAGKRIALCHEPHFFEQMLKQSPDIIFYGHTHKPWLEVRDGVQIVNPGTLGGSGTPSTFAVWDTDKPVPELVRTDTI